MDDGDEDIINDDDKDIIQATAKYDISPEFDEAREKAEDKH